VSNQPLAFGALIAGGLLITSAITGDPLTKVVSGQASILTNPSGSTRIGADLSGAINSVDGLVNPFAAAKGLKPERVDMGQDFAMTPGSPILALGDSKVLGVIHNWYQGQPYVWFQLLNEHGGTSPTQAAPYAGQFWYVAEQITPSVSVGQTVKAGQQVATYAASGTGIETGFAAPGGSTLAQAHHDVGANHFSIEGQAFSELLSKLGVHA
jgi:murein DD-endopeptidase MepM/ murein hydrolase activator NlpD